MITIKTVTFGLTATMDTVEEWSDNSDLLRENTCQPREGKNKQSQKREKLATCSTSQKENLKEEGL